MHLGKTVTKALLPPYSLLSRQQLATLVQQAWDYRDGKEGTGHLTASEVADRFVTGLNRERGFDASTAIANVLKTPLLDIDRRVDALHHIPLTMTIHFYVGDSSYLFDRIDLTRRTRR